MKFNRAKIIAGLLILGCIPFIALCAKKFKQHPSGLLFRDIKKGRGPVAKAGDRLTVHYKGVLEKTKKKFDSSYDRGTPFSFQLGKKQVIKGWDIGMAGMRKGGKRVLIIPAQLAYGERGAGDSIPPGSDLRFEVELLKIEKPPKPWSIGRRKILRTASGLRYVVFARGRGPQPKSGQIVTVHYSGFLKSGFLFDSSHSRERPFSFPIGRNRVIKGWEEGIALMRAGARYKLLIPAHLGYGDRGAGPIPGEAELEFDVELLHVR